jgi:glycosyltransferase involved in cell wall biosynthesis
LKIAQVLNFFPPDGFGGTEVYALALSRELKQLGHECFVIIPNYGSGIDEVYEYEGLKVYKFAEDTTVDRELILGLKVSQGVQHFRALLTMHRPDLVQFHELAGSNGISIEHIKAAREVGAKVIFSFHLAGYTCKTGNLLYKQMAHCDGVIRNFRCSDCYLQTRVPRPVETILAALSRGVESLGSRPFEWNNRMGTILGTSGIINKLKKDLVVLAENCSALVAIAEWYLPILINNGVPEEKLHYIAQGLPMEPPVVESSHRKVKFPLRVLFIGRIDPKKGLHILVVALEKIDPGKMKLNIYGPSSDKIYEDNLKRKTANQSNISWRGFAAQEEIIPLMRSHDLLCLCSTFSEMSPLVIQEAFAAGIPVLASNVYGNSEQITHGVNGWLFNFKDSRDLAKQLQMLIDEPNKIGQIKVNLPAVRQFRTVAQDYETLFKKIGDPG